MIRHFRRRLLIVASALLLFTTGAASAFTRPSTPPQPDSADDVIVTQTQYDDAGHPSILTDNAGLETRRTYDALGRTRTVVEHYVDGVPLDAAPDADRVTRYTYNAAGQIVTQTADLEGSANDQTTTYVYSLSLTDKGSPVKSNALLRAVIYPDSTDTVSGGALNPSFGGDRVEMTYHADGSLATRKDQRGTVLTYTYTTSGGRESQRITTLGSGGTDDTIQSITYAYDALNRLVKATSHGNVTANPADTADVENQVTYAYDGLGRMTAEKQEHDGIVDGSTHTITHSYDDTASSNLLTAGGRPAYVAYPNGRKIHSVYDGHSGIDTAVSRANKLADDNGSGSPGDPIVTYHYLGSGQAVVKDYPTPQVKLSYAEGSGGDPYDASGGGGFDRFGRIVNHGWSNYSGTPTDVLRITHAYDHASNRLHAKRSIYESHSEVYAYDNLHRLVSYKAGMVNAAMNDLETHGVYEWPQRVQQWHYDTLGNVNSRDDYGRTNWETAAYNAANEITERQPGGVSSHYRLYDQFSNAALAALWDVQGNASLSYGSDRLIVDSLDSGSNLFIALVGEETGVISPYIRPIWATSPAPSAGDYTGFIFGYKNADDYWMLVAEAISSSQYQCRLYHVISGSKGSSIAASANQTLTPGGTVSLAIRSKRNSLHGSVNYTFTNGFPSGQYGLITNVDGQTIEFSQVPWGQINSNPLGRWLDQSTAAFTTSDQMYLPGDYKKQFTPTLIDHVRGDKIKAWFKSTRSGSTTALARFFFDATDTENFKALQFRHSTSPGGADALIHVEDGHLPSSIAISQNASNAVARANETDPLWTCVIIDPDAPNAQVVRVFESATEAGLDTRIASNAYSMVSTGSLDIHGGMIGFGAGGYTIYIDDLTVQTWDADTAAWKTQLIEDFALDTTSHADDAQPTHDPAGNLTYDGVFAYSYDAWNRMVRVTKAYRNPSSPSTVSLGSVISVSEYDAPGRRVVKSVQNSGDLDCTHHYYFERQSIIEERDGSDLVLKQYVWNTTSSGYIDELVQTTINGDPVDDPEMNPSDPDHDVRHYFALHNANYNVMALIDDSGELIERYEYTPYGERQVYFSAGSNDPLAMSPLINSRRVALAGSIEAPYGLLDVGHQGLFLDEEIGNYENRRRVYIPRVARFAQHDPWEYIDGMNLYEYLQSNPIDNLDPYGTWLYGSIGNKIRLIFGRRALRKSLLGPIILGSDWLWGETYHIDDDYDEMPVGNVGYKMNDFYKAFLDKQKLDGGWQRVDIPNQSAKTLVGQFSMPNKSSIPGWDAGWWLGGSHDVTVDGSMEVCKQGQKYLVRDLSANWIWHDRIDAKGAVQLIKDGENFATILVEGILWDKLVDGLADLDFDVEVYFKDNIANTTIPPGPKR